MNKIKLRWPVVTFSLVFPIIGAALLTQYSEFLAANSADRFSASANIPQMMFGYYVIFVATVPQIMYSWANINASGSTKRVVTTAIMFCEFNEVVKGR